MARRHACIVGAGIVGCATAYALARDGWRVTLIDALPAVGQGASLANGAQLSYSYVEPLATPAALRAMPGWLIAKGSPLRWRPRAEWAHWRWLLDFVRACRPVQVRRTTEALLTLSSLSRETLHTWLAEMPGVAQALHHARPGKLVLYRDAAARTALQRQLVWQQALGCRQRLVDRDDCVALEPALAASMAEQIAFGVWTDSEEVIDGARLSQALARASGAELRLGEQVVGFDRHGSRVGGLRMASGECIAADHVVLAAGAAAPALVRPLGLRLPIEPIKGYSLTLPVADAAAAPQVSVTDAARKIVFARLGPTLRVAGFAELVGSDLRLAFARLQMLGDAVQQAFPGACDLDGAQPWAGLRPATPDGQPRIGPTPCPNLWLNVGHGALGLTLAAGSAARLASLMRPACAPIGR
ncbi:MAG TPA: D-amino acid dehydrogenase [Ideonella sp.]|uniref:D-amino acid dehydrogenase n=1 Tax=Ideonella sp. TaxID=1929293 RepID=UPI002E34D09A|nr:D-amino acid dehydrogenase [Ideonella sp.]HEX5687638.1 D-amino acid dehydrogenase [Ideonella sp.]